MLITYTQKYVARLIEACSINTDIFAVFAICKYATCISWYGTFRPASMTIIDIHDYEIYRWLSWSTNLQNVNISYIIQIADRTKGLVCWQEFSRGDKSLVHILIEL